MGDFLEQLSKYSTSQKIAGAMVLYAIIAAVLWFAFIKPTKDQIQVAQVRNVKLVEERNTNRDIAENRERWERQVELLNEELAKAIKELPNEREIPELLRRISSIGKKIGLEFLLFQPLPELPREFYADVPVKLKIEGSFHEVATFFDRIGKLNRIVNIRDISMSSPFQRSGKIVLTTDGTAVTYRFLSDAERGPETQRGRR
ncbi:MAG: type 4a pilus biogenesis protein PilO [Deltaproteobacteria bacterium]|nr:type 4a pilus biogenesis protein PilO [Deltaproteobacteria bacterium]